MLDMPVKKNGKILCEMTLADAADAFKPQEDRERAIAFRQLCMGWNRRDELAQRPQPSNCVFQADI
jgi:hypothetical protein